MLRCTPQVVVTVLVLAAHGWLMWHLQSVYEAVPDKSNVASLLDYVDLCVPVFIVSMIAEAGTLTSAFPTNINRCSAPPVPEEPPAATNFDLW
jgi:chromate transport protein ChrA